MNNGDTVTKKDFTASFKSKKEEVFESSRTKIWHKIKANVLTFGVKFFCEPCARFSAKKMRISPNFIKNRSQKSQEI
jgi:hypothetical protein